MTEPLKQCPQCKKKFPEHLIDRLFVSTPDGSDYRDSCPICALRIGNEIHGINRKEFTGTTAQQYLEEAQAFINEQ